MSQPSDDLSSGGGGDEGQSKKSGGFTKWKDYLDPRFLGAVSTPGVLNLTRPQNTTSWSRDNQVALVTDGGGITIVDFVHTHDELESGLLQFIGNESKLSCVKPESKDLENYMGVPFSGVVQSTEKSEIFGVVKDSIICPKELLNAETQLYYTKVSWSPHPFTLKKRGEEVEAQFVLGALDSHFNFRLFTKRHSRMGDEGAGEVEGGIVGGDDWQIFVDLTESYRNLLLTQFWSINVADEAAFAAGIFGEYKKRMYELATVDFIWLPQWENNNQGQSEGGGNVYSGGLVTAHASGDICIWQLCANTAPEPGFENGETRNLNYFLTLEFRQRLIQDEIVSHLDFYRLSSSLGLLVVGTTGGAVKLFKVSYNSSVSMPMKPVPADEDAQPQKYFLGEETTLCEKDLIEAQMSLGVVTQLGDGEGYRVILYVFKQPNYMQPFEIEVSRELGLSVEGVGSPIRIVKGALAGASLIQDYQDPNKTILLLVTQRGTFSWALVEGGRVEEVCSYDLGAGEETSAAIGGTVEQVKKRLQFGGLIVSPNRAMICVSKTLAEYYDHLALRSPSVLQFHSLFPTENVWNFVYAKCIENRFQLQKMTDLLTAYRVIMTSTDSYLKEVLDWAAPLKSKSVEDLQILFWILRIQPRVDKDQLSLACNLRKEEPKPFLQLKHKQVRAIRRETVVSDKIMQLRCLNLVKKVIENPEKYDLLGNLLNLQSLLTIYEYLETKTKLVGEQGSLPRKPRVLVNPPPRKPACPLCGKPTKLMDPASIEKRWVEGEDYTVEHEIDKEEIDGVLWHEQQHTQKSRSHPISNCILSLVPISFPYRKCNFCGTICAGNPSFGQEPLCPFCNGVMESPAGYYGEEELGEGSEEVQRLIREIENEKVEEAVRKKKNAPMSRKARIEKMYVD